MTDTKKPDEKVADTEAAPAKVVYEKDKVYLQNRTTGKIYPYEPVLSKHANFTSVVPNPSKKAAKEPAKEPAKS